MSNSTTPPTAIEIGDGVFAYIQPVRTIVNTHHHGDHTFGTPLDLIAALTEMVTYNNGNPLTSYA